MARRSSTGCRAINTSTSFAKIRRIPDVLYAGLEQGVWFTLDRGAHWQSLRLNMPPVAVHDMRIQPQRHDLIVATHGRGFWILDDADALSKAERRGCGRRAASLFAADRLHVVSLVDGLLRNAPRRMLPRHGQFAAENPPDGALLTYYLPASSARLDRDLRRRTAPRSLRRRSGRRRRRTRRLGSHGDAARAVAPRARWNRGGAGPTVVPGTIHDAAARRQRDDRTPARRPARSARRLDAGAIRRRATTSSNRSMTSSPPSTSR